MIPSDSATPGSVSNDAESLIKINYQNYLSTRVTIRLFRIQSLIIPYVRYHTYEQDDSFLKKKEFSPLAKNIYLIYSPRGPQDLKEIRAQNVR